jgi:hypothetical protein
MKQLTKLEIQQLIEIEKTVPYLFSEVRDIYNRLGTIALTKAIIDYSLRNNVSIDQAIEI